jgi:hypothetical protein
VVNSAGLATEYPGQDEAGHGATAILASEIRLANQVHRRATHSSRTFWPKNISRRDGHESEFVHQPFKYILVADLTTSLTFPAIAHSSAVSELFAHLAIVLRWAHECAQAELRATCLMRGAKAV